MKPSRRRLMVSYWHDTYRVSERRACRVARMAVSTFRYESRQEPRTALRLRIREIAQTRVRYGYRKIRVLLNREGWKVGKKLVYRLYREEGLTLRHKPRRKRRAALHRRERFRPTAPNEVWSLDFVADQLADGRRFRALTIMDVFTRESLAIEVGQRLKGEDVVSTLNEIRLTRGGPKFLFCDNGAEFTSQIMDLWAYHNQVRIGFSAVMRAQPRCPCWTTSKAVEAICLALVGRSQRDRLFSRKREFSVFWAAFYFSIAVDRSEERQKSPRLSESLLERLAEIQTVNCNWSHRNAIRSVSASIRSLKGNTGECPRCRL